MSDSNIEVEGRFEYSESLEQQIEREVQLVRQEDISDIYFDTLDYQWTLNDMWLRNRNSVFELKVPVEGNFKSDVYAEIYDHNEIKEHLGLDLEDDLPSIYRQKMIEVIATIETFRKTYLYKDCHICIDRCDFDYNVIEVEKLCSSDSIESADQSVIHHSMEIFGMKPEQSKINKVFQYIKLNNPRHFSKLKKAAIIKNPE